MERRCTPTWGTSASLPIRLTWFAVVLPSLLLNYFGQGAMLIENPSTIEHPFFLMAPGWALYPLVLLATAATVIASQAVISGAFSLTRQAVQLGYLPRLKIDHTSTKHVGQIYLPAINWALAIACIGLVLGFRTSSNLASAYGVAVTTDMVFTTILFAVVARTRLGWGRWATGLLVIGLLVVDLSYWGANLPKVPDGGWFPLFVAAAVFTAMTTWKRGRQILGDRLRERIRPLEQFLREQKTDPLPRVPGTAVYMASNPSGMPSALVHNVDHNKVLHERVIILTLSTHEVPYVPFKERLRMTDLGQDFYRVVGRYGFAQDPDVPALLRRCQTNGDPIDLEDTTFFLGRETLIATKQGGMATWRERLFAFMTRNARTATDFFHIPADRVVEMGAQIEI